MKMIKKVSITAATAMMGVALIGSSYISPAMAQSSVQGPAGLQQAAKYTALADPSVTQDGLTMTISKAVFDGTNMSMEISTPGNKIFSVTNKKGSVRGVDILYNNKFLNFYYFENDAPNATGLTLLASNELLTERTIGGGSIFVQFPEQINVTVRVYLTGYGNPFTFVVPLTKTTNNPINF